MALGQVLVCGFYTIITLHAQDMQQCLVPFVLLVQLKVCTFEDQPADLIRKLEIKAKHGEIILIHVLFGIFQASRKGAVVHIKELC